MPSIQVKVASSSRDRSTPTTSVPRALPSEFNESVAVMALTSSPFARVRAILPRRRAGLVRAPVCDRGDLQATHGYPVGRGVGQAGGALAPRAQNHPDHVGPEQLV